MDIVTCILIHHCSSSQPFLESKEFHLKVTLCSDASRKQTERKEVTEGAMPEKWQQVWEQGGPLARFCEAGNETNSRGKDLDKQLELVLCVCTLWLI